MNASLLIDQLSVSEQRELLLTLVDRLYPESADGQESAFPKWLMDSLEEQNQRYQAGIETGELVETMDARFRAKWMRP